jgi:tRNA A-37 threonylcarbamoyl transferase component Bud32
MITSYYHKTVAYLKKLTQDELNELVKRLSATTINLQKKNMMIDLLSMLTSNPKKRITHTSLRSVQPNKKGKHPCCKGYTVISTLGSGMFGTALLVEKDKKKYVIKEISIKTDTWSLSPDIQMKQIESEIAIHKQLGKLNISPKVYDAYVCKERGTLKAYIVMEHMTEGTLDEWLNTNVLTKHYKQQITDKVSKMHAHNFIHNDLHLQNILVTKEKGKYEFYIGDLGLSFSPTNILQKLKENDNKMLNDNLSFKTNDKYNMTIANLFVIWKLI